MVDGLRLLQELARTGDRPATYSEFAEQLQLSLAPIAAARVWPASAVLHQRRLAERHLLRRLRDDGECAPTADGSARRGRSSPGSRPGSATASAMTGRWSVRSPRASGM
jgi:hypothetical protein